MKIDFTKLNIEPMPNPKLLKVQRVVVEMDHPEKAAGNRYGFITNARVHPVAGCAWEALNGTLRRIRQTYWPLQAQEFLPPLWRMEQSHSGHLSRHVDFDPNARVHVLQKDSGEGAMIFKRERQTYPTVHWKGGQWRGSRRVYCGITITDDMAHTMEKEKVSCQRCIQCMKRHDHLPKADSEYDH